MQENVNTAVADGKNEQINQGELYRAYSKIKKYKTRKSRIAFTDGIRRIARVISSILHVLAVYLVVFNFMFLIDEIQLSLSTQPIMKYFSYLIFFGTDVKKIIIDSVVLVLGIPLVVYYFLLIAGVISSIFIQSMPVNNKNAVKIVSELYDSPGIDTKGIDSNSFVGFSVVGSIICCVALMVMMSFSFTQTDSDVIVALIIGTAVIAFAVGVVAFIISMIFYFIRELHPWYNNRGLKEKILKLWYIVEPDKKDKDEKAKLEKERKERESSSRSSLNIGTIYVDFDKSKMPRSYGYSAYAFRNGNIYPLSEGKNRLVQDYGYLCFELKVEDEFSGRTYNFEKTMQFRGSESFSIPWPGMFD